jgi:glutamate 5-kinase
MNKIIFRKELSSVKTIVVKTGSRILASEGSDVRIERLTGDLAALHRSGIRVVLVSSGAIMHGMQAMGMTARPTTIPVQQACASVGQNRLMNRYQSFFEKHGILIGQVLLTWDDLRSKKRYLNLRNTLFALLDGKTIPIVNENDSVGVEEIKFGTNDILAAQIALLVQADVLVNLTDVGGLFDCNPTRDPSAKHIPIVPEISALVHKMAVDSKNDISVGGMGSKLKAAEMVTRAGIYYLIGDGFHGSLLDVLCKDSSAETSAETSAEASGATIFLPSRQKMSSRHRWIAFSGNPKGTLSVDGGAQIAIRGKGKSLLPAGINNVTGSFNAGDTVEIKTGDGTVIARGLVNYSSDEIRRIMGCNTADIAALLGSKEFDEVVHRDNLVVL